MEWKIGEGPLTFYGDNNGVHHILYIKLADFSHFYTVVWGHLIFCAAEMGVSHYLE